MPVSSTTTGVSSHDDSECLIMDSTDVADRITLILRGSLIPPSSNASVATIVGFGQSVIAPFTRAEFEDLYQFIAEWLDANP